MIVVVAMEGSRTLVLSSLRMPFPFRWSHPTDASITVTIEINSSTVNYPYKRPGCQFNFRGQSHNCNKLNKTNMLSTKISRKFKNSVISTPSIDTSRPSRDPYRSFKSQHRCQNLCSGLLCCHH